MVITAFFSSHFILFLTLIGLIGLIVGSFLNVVIYRLPIMMQTEWRQECAEFLQKPIKPAPPFNIARPRSHCPHCEAMISWWANIPLFSYLLLRGKCANCKHAIAFRYPLVEFLSGLISVLVAYQLGGTWPTAFALFFVWVLLAASFIDFETQLLPDNLSLSLLWVGLLVSLAGYFTTPADAIVGATLGYVSLWVVAWLFKWVRGMEGMGHGDFKLCAALGAWFGWHMLPLIILIAALVGALVGISLILFKGYKRTQPIPFGPYLALAGVVTLLWGPSLFAWYWQLTIHY